MSVKANTKEELGETYPVHEVERYEAFDVEYSERVFLHLFRQIREGGKGARLVR